MSRIELPTAEAQKAPSKATKPAAKSQESWRDFIEQIVIAILMAMLVRGFEAEAFVIPTGSMAPTLMGRHKEVDCPQCGITYAVNASEEDEKFITSRRLADVGICGNCRFRTPVDSTPSFKGDRILVMKFPYELPALPASGGPSRWDVVVFHFPEAPETNYIKRLVGLPGDDLRIHHGDLQTRPTGTNAPFVIERKPLFHQDAMQMLVYDDAHHPKAFDAKPEWRRWQGQGGWAEEAPGSYKVAATDPAAWADLRYRHLVPDPEQWESVAAGATPARGPRPTLITDFYAYNTNISRASYDSWVQQYDGYLQSNWVGDLTVSGRVEVLDAKPGAKLRLELVEAGVSHRCEIDLATGTATLYRGDGKLGEAPTALRGTGSHDVKFANVDDRLTLRVDGATPFGDGLAYEVDPSAPAVPTDRDLDPVGLAAAGATVRASGLVLQRDIYYTQDPGRPDFNIRGASEAGDRDGYGRVVRMFDFLADPAKFAELKDLPVPGAFVVRPGNYLMMGDNSPRSADSRAWESRDSIWRSEDRYSWEVPRSLLIGKAFFIYWPHGKPFGPDLRLSRDFRLPFRPYLERMKWIR